MNALLEQPAYIANAGTQSYGSVNNAIIRSGGDPCCMRPFMFREDPLQRSFVTVNQGGQERLMVVNATATLLKDEWQLVDDVIIKVAKERLRAIGDVRAAGLQYTIPEGMGKTVLQYQAMSDITPATIAMDPRTQSQQDRPVFDLVNLPLPLIMKDFSFGIRELMESRNRGQGLDLYTAELAGRRVAEAAEALLLGTAATYQYGGGFVYGYLNFPQRNTKTLTNPTAGGWTAAVTITEILDMKLKSMLDLHYGPWMIYTSVSWDPYLDTDYSAAKGDRTLRERIKAIQNILDVRTLDYLTGYCIILVQMTNDTVRAVVGMDIVTVQWEGMGGFEANFKVMAMIVPQLRADRNGNCGIVVGIAP